MKEGTLKSPYKKVIMAQKSLEKAESEVCDYEHIIRDRCEYLVKAKYSKYVRIFITSFYHDAKKKRFEFVADCWDYEPDHEEIRYESGDLIRLYVDMKSIESKDWKSTKLKLQ